MKTRTRAEQHNRNWKAKQIRAYRRIDREENDSMNERKAFSIGQVCDQCRNQVAEIMSRFGNVTTDDLMSILHTAQIRKGYITTVYYKDAMLYVEHTARKGS